MAQVALDGKLSCQILPTFQVLPSDIPSSSFRHSESFLPTFQVLPSDIPSPSFQLEKNFPTTGKNFPSDRKKISCCPSVNHSNFRKLRTFWSNDRKSFSFQLEKIFLPTGKNFPDNWKSFSFQQEKFFLPTGKVLPSDRTQTNVRRTTNRVHSKARRTDSPSTTTD
ncbi:hypothetical protein TVAG_479260 [Trichomonas vaginalis G3]|uniref:Uncharacterized protein n=1 Tax=Trichomonas vaginalis (strain ATCC PRA-98 / G3) TaxID=412133 RepID=A2GZH1_TRIV3|nr:hypothetical protein TVAGG3_0369880 [Trichomonas vaginalis G3]EAX77446.1 hypothetical protein TVAG_479260 [Trichomonas vaginalis G3]KAI5532538.1 hypothetical protein TVAGG3_0369880 [Trichomonas vaginalis G3]|eukprot:XP_001290376.1 hypothetical protein [Trichomonas vaginalis G3]